MKSDTPVSTFPVYNNVQDIGSSQGVVWASGLGARSKYQTGVPVDIIKQVFPPSCALPRVPINGFGDEVACHQDRHSPAETRGQIRSEQ